MMEIGVAEIRANLAEVINRVAYGGERIILQRRASGCWPWCRWTTWNC